MPNNINFPNVVKLLQVYKTHSLTTATMERIFSTLKLVETNLRNCLKDCMLDWCMRIAIEGPDSLSDDDITAIIQIWKENRLGDSFFDSGVQSYFVRLVLFLHNYSALIYKNIIY